jgi:hypothetical protein
MRLQAGCAPDWGAQEELVQELQRHQTEYTFTTMAFANALYSSILSPEQVGRPRGQGPLAMRRLRANRRRTVRNREPAARAASAAHQAPWAGTLPLPTPATRIPPLCLPGQAAAVWVSSHPYVPSLIALGHALEDIRAERGAEAAGAGSEALRQASAGTPSAPAPAPCAQPQGQPRPGPRPGRSQR